MNSDEPTTEATTTARPGPDRDRDTMVAGTAALQRILDGEQDLSPAARTLHLRLAGYSDRSVTMTAAPGEWALNAGGTVHGGIVSAWVDSALGYATATAVEEGVGYNTLDLTVRYIRALRLENTPVEIRAEVEHCGRSTAVVQVKVVDTEERTCASASGVMMLFRP